METKPKTEIDLKAVESLAYRGLTQAQIADALGIAESTLYKRKKESKEIGAAIKRGRAKGVAVVAGCLMDLVKKGNVAATIYYMKAIGGFSEVDRKEITGKDGKDLSVAPVLVIQNDLKD